MKLLPIILLTLISLSTQAQEYDALDNKNVLYFIADLKKSPDFTYSELVNIFDNVKIKKKIKNHSKKSKQSEFVLYWEDYKKRVISKTRIKNGKAFIIDNLTLLSKIEKEYKIPKEFITAISGIESNYGSNFGNNRAIDSLATMAFENNPRSKFFKSQIKSFLIRCTQTKLDCFKTKSSWAGAIGYGQFIPTSIDAFGVDYNKNGIIDLVNEKEDALASIANYLKKNGWKTDAKVLKEIYPNKNNHRSLLSTKLSLNTSVNEIKKLNVSGLDNLANKKVKLFEVKTNKNKKQTFIGYNNFKTITSYNRSNLYALGVYHLANSY
jgi:membrane-bound lytic murein transglycosylase B